MAIEALIGLQLLISFDDNYSNVKIRDKEHSSLYMSPHSNIKLWQNKRNRSMDLSVPTIILTKKQMSKNT